MNVRDAMKMGGWEGQNGFHEEHVRRAEQRYARAYALLHVDEHVYLTHTNGYGGMLSIIRAIPPDQEFHLGERQITDSNITAQAGTYEFVYQPHKGWRSEFLQVYEDGEQVMFIFTYEGSITIEAEQMSIESRLLQPTCYDQSRITSGEASHIVGLAYQAMLHMENRYDAALEQEQEIGRASCRERV